MKKDYEIIRNDILYIIGLYNYIKSFKNLDKDKINYIKNFYHITKEISVEVFFIRLRKLFTTGSLTLNKNKNGTPHFYADKKIAHRTTSDAVINDESVELVYKNLIDICKKIDEKIGEVYYYDGVIGFDSIDSLELILDSFINFNNFKDKFEFNKSKLVSRNILSGKLEIDKFSNIDFLFIELYIKKKYNQKVEEYFNIHKMSVSSWRKSNQVPERRLYEFSLKEGTSDIEELFKILYKN